MGADGRGLHGGVRQRSRCAAGASHSGRSLLRGAFPETISASESIGDESLLVLGTCYQQGEKITHRKRLLRKKRITGRLMGQHIALHMRQTWRDR